MRGPISVPAAISLRHCCSTSNSPPMSRTPVTPLAMNSGSVTSLPRGNQSPKTMWTCMSHKPGDQELAGAVHHELPVASRSVQIRGSASMLCDMAVAHDDGAMRLGRRTGRVNDGDIVDDQDCRRREDCAARNRTRTTSQITTQRIGASWDDNLRVRCPR